MCDVLHGNSSPAKALFHISTLSSRLSSLLLHGFQHAEHFPIPTDVIQLKTFFFRQCVLSSLRSRVCVCVACKRRRVILNIVISVLLNLHEYFLMSVVVVVVDAHTRPTNPPNLAIWQLLILDFEIFRTDGAHSHYTACCSRQLNSI